MIRLDAAIIGVKEFKEAIDKTRAVTASALSKAVRDSAIDLKNKAQDLAPRDTSRLRGSIHYQGPYVTSDNVYAIIGTNVEYAPYQEFGTGIYAGRGMIISKRAGVRRIIRGIRGKHYFQNALDYTKPILSDRIRVALGEIISHLAKG